MMPLHPAAIDCEAHRLSCVLQDIANSMNDPWPTLWLTFIATVVGALVASIVAWMFALDLRRRDRDDREQEREQDRLDREAERTQAAADRRAELDAERKARAKDREDDRIAREAERQEERDHEHGLMMRRQWLALEDLITRFHWADPQGKVDLYPEIAATTTLTGALAKGEDRKVFDVFNDLFLVSDFEEHGPAISSIIAVYARDGMPTKFAIEQFQEVARERDEAKAGTQDSDAPSDEAAE